MKKILLAVCLLLSFSVFGQDSFPAINKYGTSNGGLTTRGLLTSETAFTPPYYADTAGNAEARFGGSVIRSDVSGDTLTYVYESGKWEVAQFSDFNNKITDGGDANGADVVVGTNDANDLVFETNNSDRGRILDDGRWVLNETSALSGSGADDIVQLADGAFYVYNSDNTGSTDYPMFVGNSAFHSVADFEIGMREYSAYISSYSMDLRTYDATDVARESSISISSGSPTAGAVRFGKDYGYGHTGHFVNYKGGTGGDGWHLFTPEGLSTYGHTSYPYRYLDFESGSSTDPDLTINTQSTANVMRVFGATGNIGLGGVTVDETDFNLQLAGDEVVNGGYLRINNADDLAVDGLHVYGENTNGNHTGLYVRNTATTGQYPFASLKLSTEDFVGSENFGLVFNSPLFNETYDIENGLNIVTVKGDATSFVHSNGTTTKWQARYFRDHIALFPQADGNVVINSVSDNSLGALQVHGDMWSSGKISLSGVTWSVGAGSPEGVVTAIVGSRYSRTDGGAGTTDYVKESGSGNTGWVAK